MKHRLFQICVYVLALALLIFGIIKFVGYVTYKETNTYSLEEIENGKYVVYQRVVSAIPAQNYEMATLCIAGNIVTVKGNVHFVFGSDTTEKAIIERIHLVNGDTATIYISKDKVEYADTITVR